MALDGHVFTAPDGVRGFDANFVIKPDVGAAFVQRDYRFCVRYVRRQIVHDFDLSAGEADALIESGLGLMVVQHVESETAWAPTADKGAANGDVAAMEADHIGIPYGVMVWCDLEGVAVGTPAAQVVDYCNRWHAAVAGAGYVPGLYVGFHCGLDPTQLYRALRFSHYWGAYNLNADEVPIVRGLQMKQSSRKPGDVVPGHTFDFQVDTVRADSLGGRPTLAQLPQFEEVRDVVSGT